MMELKTSLAGTEGPWVTGSAQGIAAESGDVVSAPDDHHGMIPKFRVGLSAQKRHFGLWFRDKY